MNKYLFIAVLTVLALMLCTVAVCLAFATFTPHYA